MTKGGTRAGAGRKSKWSDSKTVNIRVPEYLATEVTAYAQQLDKQRIAESEQRQLMTLLQELVHVPRAKRSEWIEALPESSRSTLEDAEGKIEVLSTEFKSQRIHLSDPEQDAEQVSTLNEKFEVGLEVYSVEGPVPALVATSSLEHKWVFLQQDGKYVIDLPVPLKEGLSISIDNGVIFLELRSKWSVGCLMPRSALPDDGSPIK